MRFPFFSLVHCQKADPIKTAENSPWI